MYKIIHTTRFKKDLKKFRNNIPKTEIISDCIELLESGGVMNIPPEMKPHKLK
jgi:mRNA interferase YafQ